MMGVSTAQVVLSDNHVDTENRDFYFIVNGSDGSRPAPTEEAPIRKDILDMFISDSITFYIRSKQEHFKMAPHLPKQVSSFWTGKHSK